MKREQVMEGLEILHVSGEAHPDVADICFASDQCREGALFVAIPGLKNDGHDFIQAAISRGARVIIHEKNLQIDSRIMAIRVKDSRRALGIVSRNFFQNPSADLKLIAVTGTNGKTTTSYLLESIFAEAGLACGVLGTVNYRYGDKVYAAPNTTPESYEMQKVLRAMADEGVSHVVTEISSHAIDLKRVDACDFDVAIFTNLTRDHLDYHLTMESYFQAKKRLFAEILPESKKVYPWKMLVNADDPWGQRLLQEVAVPSLTYGIESNCPIRAVNYQLSLSGIRADIDLAGEAFSIASPLIGKYNLYNILAAVGAAFILKIPLNVIKRGIKKLSRVPGRLEAVIPSGNFSVFVDYAHTDDALRNVLQCLSDVKKRRIITVFGCGGNRDAGKRPLMGQAAAQYSDVTIITSDNPRLEDPLSIIADIERGMDAQTVQRVQPDDFPYNGDARVYTVIPDRKTAINAAINAADEDDIVLIAGKGHEDYQILGTRKVPFDDRVTAREILDARSRLKQIHG